MANGVLLGLTAALCWGVADYCLRGAIHTVGTFRSLYFMQIIGLLALFIGVVPWLRPSFAGASPSAILAAVGLSLVILVAAALLYRAFAIGKLAVVSPIAASFGAIATALALLTGERPSPTKLFGLALLLVGVTLSGMAPLHRETNLDGTAGRRRLLGPGVREALAATLLFGVTYFALRFVVAQVGSVQTAIISKVTEFVALSLLVLVGWASRRFVHMPAFAQGTMAPAGQALAPRDGAFWLWLIPGAILDIIANIAYNFGVAGALTSVVATLSSLFTAVTVVLAWIFLRERLTRIQWTGVAIILVGIVLVNL
jgi:drug/metabolite transporter (DMT)-like permease